MNYLAHLYFSAPDPLAWAGSLMGDFVKGALDPALPEQLARHLILHRRLDSYTRTSPPFQASRRRIDARFRHGRSVMVDVFYDHLLACRWEEYHQQSLEEFSGAVYAGLYRVHEVLPISLQQTLPRMKSHNWLLSYRDTWAIERVLQRLEERLGQRLPLASGVTELDRLREELEGDFQIFMQQTALFTAAFLRRPQ